MKRTQTCTATSSSTSPSSSASSSSSASLASSDIPIRSEVLRPKKRAKRSKKSSVSCDKTENPTSPVSGRRSSIYRGVTRHRWTGRFEAHLWDKSSWNSIQNKKGKQVYLGAYDSEDAAARTYDLAALKYWGSETILNFPVETYTKELEEMQRVSKEEYLASLRRQSSGFSRGVSKYRGVARHHHNGRWEARIGRVFGNKYLYLGTYNTQEEAAAAYDMAAIEYRGANAVTNFDISNYIDRLTKKGIFPFPVNQTGQEPVLESSVMVSPKQMIETREVKAEPPQQEPEPGPNHYIQPPEQTQEVQELQYMDSSAIAGMEPLKNNNNNNNNNNDDHNNNNNDNELAWSFCMDSGLTPFLTDEKLTTEKPIGFSELLDGIGFEDNIDFMFEEVKPDCLMLENPSCCEFDELVVGRERLSPSSAASSPISSSSSDSPSSTTTSVSCNYSV